MNDQMEQETHHVLEMLRSGRITPEQAAKLLEALETTAQQPSPRSRARALRINVTDTRSGRTRVNVSVPLGLVEIASKLGLSLGVKSAPALAAVNFDEIMTAIKDGAEGQIVDIVDDDDRQHVVVAVE